MRRISQNEMIESDASLNEAKATQQDIDEVVNSLRERLTNAVQYFEEGWGSKYVLALAGYILDNKKNQTSRELSKMKKSQSWYQFGTHI